MIVWDGPRYLIYNTKSEQLRTYADEPHGMNPTPEALSESGFYFTDIFYYYLFSKS